MGMRSFWVCVAVVLAGAVHGFAQQQQQSGPRTLETLLKDDGATPTRRPAAVDATEPVAPAAVPAGRIQGAVARPKDGVQHPDLDAAWAEYDKQIETAAKAIEQAIEKELNAAAEAGNLDDAVKWKTAGEQFKKDGRIPEGLDGFRTEVRPHRRERPLSEKPGVTPRKRRSIQSEGGPSTVLAEAWEKLASAYVAVEQDLVRSLDLDKAKLVRAERETISSGVSSNLQKKPSEWEDITAQLVGGVRQNQIIVVQGKEKVVSNKPYSPPLEIEYVCATSRNNIRLGFACDELIFNWELNNNELRIGGGPAHGKHVMNAGEVPAGKMITIRQVVTPAEMTVYVDEQKRASWEGDFSKVIDLIDLFCPDSELRIKTVRVRQGLVNDGPQRERSAVGLWLLIKPDGAEAVPATHCRVTIDGRFEVVGQQDWSGTYTFGNKEQTRLFIKCNNGRSFTLQYDSAADRLTQDDGFSYRRVVR